MKTKELNRFIKNNDVVEITLTDSGYKEYIKDLQSKELMCNGLDEDNVVNWKFTYPSTVVKIKKETQNV